MQISTWVFKILILFLVNFSRLSRAQTCSEVDRTALLGFKARIFKDTTGIMSSWIGKDCCSGGWEGVQCDSVTGRVTQLVLQRPSDKDFGIYMKGTLSPTLGDLKFLEVLVISGMKRLSGTIPTSFTGLVRLTQLALEDNSLEGTIPSSLGQLPLLQTLSLSGNHLTGPIPPTLLKLNKLFQLNLARNSFSGPLPAAMGGLARLQYLDLSYNKLSGSIPVSLGQLSQLTLLDISNNQLSGAIPDSLCNLLKLVDLTLSNNLLTGQVPSRIGRLKSLNTLSLGSNRLVGQIPVSISQLQNLWYLNLSRNALSDPSPSYALSKGGLPGYFRKMSNLQNVKLSNNQLKANLSQIILPSGLALLDLHSNQLSGSLSGLLRSASSFLETIDLSNNQITGNIPSTISKLAKLKKLDVSRNHITGTIPPSLGNLSNLGWLDVSINSIGGKIPTSLLVAQLRHANFRANKLCGEIPQGRPLNIFPPVAYAHNLCLCGKPLPPCKQP
uniref:LRR receptor-like serine/threonine-protein kinase FLS2 isoform X2 n=1 Tax=Erigeron canadensis TaxID=72917 RepID=UPI001CB8AD9F|nr:LRR receptor-like serine/threonine-protein kinase FLS2 isoform X2 [Erigeron canadensis]